MGDVVYNPRRKLIAALPKSGKITYHLFNLQYLSGNYHVNLLRKAKASTKYKPCNQTFGCKLRMFHFHNWLNFRDDWTSGYDFEPNGDLFAFSDSRGIYFISDVDSNNIKFELSMNKGGSILFHCHGFDVVFSSSYSWTATWQFLFRLLESLQMGSEHWRTIIVHKAFSWSA